MTALKPLPRMSVAPARETHAIVAAKTPKQAVLYMNSDPQGDYICGDCMFFIDDKNRCTLHPKDQQIQETGSCGYWIRGHSQTGAEPEGKITREVSGYTDGTGEGFSCKRCRYFLEEQRDCEKVDPMSEGIDPGTIMGDSCCNAWEAKGYEKRTL